MSVNKFGLLLYIYSISILDGLNLYYCVHVDLRFIGSTFSGRKFATVTLICASFKVDIFKI